MKKAEILERIGTECTYVRGRTYVNPHRAIVLDYGWQPSSSYYGLRGRAGYRRDGANGVAIALAHTTHYDGVEETTWYPQVVPASTLKPETYAEFTADMEAQREVERAKHRAAEVERKARNEARQKATGILKPLFEELFGHSVYISSYSDEVTLTPEDKMRLAEVLTHYDFITAVR